MKTLLISVALAAFISGAAAQANAISVDGSKADWNLSSPNVVWADTNGKGTNYWGKDYHYLSVFDINGMGFTMSEDTKTLYYLIDSSKLGRGDLAINLNYKPLDDTKGNVNNELNDAGEARGRPFEFGVDVNGKGGVYAMNTAKSWDTSHLGEWNAPLEINTKGSTLVSTNGNGSKMAKNGNIIEGSIDAATLGLATFCNVPIELAFTTISCLKDVATVKGTCTGNCGGNNEIPEPSTLLLLGSALVGVSRIRARRKAA